MKGEQYRYLKDEISEKVKHNKKGIVAMATAGKDMVGSQFYITLTNEFPRLDGKYTIIGEVVEGLETLNKINEAVVDLSGRPVQVLRIQHTIMLDDPFPDPLGLKIPDRSPSPPRNWPFKMLPEDLTDLEESEDARRARLAEEAARAKAEALVLMGELPDVDVKPPDTILFVCKLNPTTTGRSLSVIFSRFGQVLSSDVIHDRHGNSLCYAFIEFNDRPACEEAYLKMQNVLIDGRRIHVDFCQSVSKTENFRAAGGWKSFFADRAKGFNASHSSNDPHSRNQRSIDDAQDAPRGGLQLSRKMGSNAPLSFSSAPSHHQHDRHSHGSGPRRQYNGDERRLDQDSHRDSYRGSKDSHPRESHRYEQKHDRYGDQHDDDRYRRSDSSQDRKYPPPHADDRYQDDRPTRTDYRDDGYRSHGRPSYRDGDEQQQSRDQPPPRKRPGSPLNEDQSHKRSRYY